MQHRLNNLRETEEQLDRLCKAMRENYKQARKNPANEFFAYVTRDDLLDVFDDESVILTVRNCDTVRQSKVKSEDDQKKHTLRVSGRWKQVDVRLVTTDGEVAKKAVRHLDDIETDGDSSDAPKLLSASQPETKTVIAERKAGRRRKQEQFELKDDSSMETYEPKSKKLLTEEEKELEERRITAETLLAYRPPLIQRKRNLNEDWLESRYNNVIICLVLLQSKNRILIAIFIFSIFTSSAATNTNQAHPLVRLSPPRSRYTYTLRRTEGICDLFHPMGGPR